MSIRLAGRYALLSILLTLASTIFASSDPPDLEINGQTGNIESLDATWRGTNYDIRHVIDPGQGAPKIVTTVTTATDDDLRPRIAIETGGDTWAAWWRDGATRKIMHAKHDMTSGTWSSAAQVSESDEDSLNPELVYDGDSIWIAYEVRSGEDKNIAVAGIGDSPEPFPGRVTVGTTGFSGDVDLGIHSENGSLWVTWVDSNQDVGWSEYDDFNETWSTANFESYQGDSVEAARGRIRTTILGG